MRTKMGLLLFLVAFVTVAMLFWPNEIQAQARSGNENASRPRPAPDRALALPGEDQAKDWTNCQPVQVMVWSSRVHVKCKTPVVDPDNPAGAIWYFAYPTSDAPAAQRVLSTWLDAQVTNRSLTILFNFREHSDLANSIGCLWADCRIAYASGFGAQ